MGVCEECVNSALCLKSGFDMELLQSLMINSSVASHKALESVNRDEFEQKKVVASEIFKLADQCKESCVYHSFNSEINQWEVAV